MAGELRVLARSLLTARGRAGRGAVGGVALAVALAALVAEIAAWQAARGRDHQAAAARRTATDATELVLDHPPATRRQGRAPVGCGERPGTRQATAAWRVGAIPPPAEQRAHHDPTDRDPTASDLRAQAGAAGVGAGGFGAGVSADVVGGSVVTDRQEQAVLAVVRLIGDQDVEVTAQHASSTSAAVTVRIGRALLYLNDQATAAHFHKVWFDAAGACPHPAAGRAPCAPRPGPRAARDARTRHRRQRGRPPGVQRRDGRRRPAGRQAVPAGPARPGRFRRSATSPPTAPAWARSAKRITWPGTCSCPRAARGSTTARSPPPATPSTPTPPTPRTRQRTDRARHGAAGSRR